MDEEVTVAMPLHPTPEMLRAVRNHELTQYKDRDKMNFLIGWLYCAYDVMIEERTKAHNNEVRGGALAPSQRNEVERS